MLLLGICVLAVWVFVGAFAVLAPNSNLGLRVVGVMWLAPIVISFVQVLHREEK